MTEDERCNGWSNRPTWSIWIDVAQNESAFLMWNKRAVEVLAEPVEAELEDKREAIARALLGDLLLDFYERQLERTMGRHSNGVHGTIGRWALHQVAWREIATALIAGALDK